MKKINMLLLVIFMTTTNSLFSQSDCKYGDSKYDEFTKIRSINTLDYVIYDKIISFTNNTTSHIKYYVGAGVRAGVKQFYLTKSKSGGHPDYMILMEHGTTIILLENDETVTLNSPGVSQRVENRGVETQSLIYKLNDEEWKILSQIPVKKIRVQHVNSRIYGEMVYQNFDMEIIKKYNDNIMHVLNCIDNLDK